MNLICVDAILVWLGRYVRRLGGGPRWFATGLEMVRRATVEQILGDGIDHEGSLAYHVLVLETFLVAHVAAGEAHTTVDGRPIAKGGALARFNDAQGARSALLEALDQDRGKYVTWAPLGDLAVRTGDLEQARARYRQALQRKSRRSRAAAACARSGGGAGPGPLWLTMAITQT